MRILLFLALLGVVVAEAPKPCVFCEIIAGTRQQESIVYRDDKVVAFLGIGPRNPGHMLIVPVAHAENFLGVPADTMHAITDTARRIAEAIRRTDLEMDSFVLQMNTGKAAGQSVFHAHLHLIPRYEDEPPAKTPDEARQCGDGQSSADKPMIGPKGDESRAPTGRDSSQDRVGPDLLAPVAAKIRAALAAKP